MGALKQNRQVQKLAPSIDRIAAFLLLTLLAVGLFVQQDVGLADNGDFNRSAELFTRIPEGGQTANPVQGSDEWKSRFFKYWIPDWKLHARAGVPTSSAVLLWLPGILTGALVTNGEMVALPIVAIFPKLLLILLVALLLGWVRRREPARGKVLAVLLGTLLVVMLTTTDYVVYFTSFYQETASFIFLMGFLASLVALAHGRHWKRTLAVACMALLLLSTSRSGAVYWPVLGMLIIPLTLSRSAGAADARTSRRMRIIAGFLASSLVLIVTLWHSVARPINASDPEVNPYNSLFYGVLAFSDETAVHLSRLSMPDAAPCVGEAAFTTEGNKCFKKYQHLMRFENTLDVIWREPAVVGRMLSHVSRSMQDISLEYLGRYSCDDAGGTPSEPAGKNSSAEERFLGETHRSSLSLWTMLKFRAFPTGATLVVVLACLSTVFVWGSARSRLCRELSLVGLTVTVGCVMEMMVAILGDGKWELIKHLAVANFQFDLAVIAFVGLITLEAPWIVSIVRRRYPLRHEERSSS